MTFGLWLVHPVLSHDVQDMCAYAMLAWPYVGMLMGTFYIKGVADMLVGVCRRKERED